MFNPFEQFIINPVYYLHLFWFDFSFTTVSVSLLVFFGIYCFVLFFLVLSISTQSLYLIPTGLTVLLYMAFSMCYAIVDRHLNVQYYKQIFFPIVYSLAIFLFVINFGGTIPGSSSLTSQLAVLVSFFLPIVIGIFSWALSERQLTIFRSFYSPGMASQLAITLFPVEVLTFVMRPVSIIARLFSNFMSGHVIFKVLLGAIFDFSTSGFAGGLAFSILVSFCLLSLIPLAMLEIAICFIQVYVFVVIFCMFLSDCFGHYYRH